MRLSSIKLAGFKSFVDPTVVDLRSNLVGILGPNGCGKSNTIDAVRWVMGETSAKHLRGHSMEDVIFNGSSSRKPVGQASVELVFDNSDKTLGGEYAKFNELSVKRLVSRDGQSKYFLNGSRCRRRDITDIFLGTGLGPRSYAIIEQGMISRLIDAKPEELRVYIEEAAGISKYKERRRETENRIRHTRENLERLGDLQEEIDKQLVRLKRQSEAALKYKRYKEDERQLAASLLVLKLSGLKQVLQDEQATLNHKATEHQGLLTQQRSLESMILQERVKREDVNEALNQEQGEYYRVGADMSRLEQRIQHQKEWQQRHQRDLQQAETSMLMARQQQQEEQERLQSIESDLEVLQPELEALHEAALETSEQVEQADEQKSAWQERWIELQEQINTPKQTAQLEKQRMQQLEGVLREKTERLARWQAQREKHAGDSSLDSIEALEERHELHLEQVSSLQDSLHGVTEQLDSIMQMQKQQQKVLADKRMQLQTVQGQLASLKALQQASLGHDDKKRQAWLREKNLVEHGRLAEGIDVDQDWQSALEVVLGADLQGVMVDSLDDYTQAFDDEKYPLTLFDQHCSSAETVDLTERLSAKVHRPLSLKSSLTHVYCVEDLAAALQKRGELSNGEFSVTPSGVCVGSHWLRMPNRLSDDNAGVLVRQERLLALQAEFETLAADIEQQEEQLDELQYQLEAAQVQKQEQEQRYRTTNKELSQLASEINNLRYRYEQAQHRFQQLDADCEDLQAQIDNDKANVDQAWKARNRALEALETLEHEREALEKQRDVLQTAVQDARKQAAESQEIYQEARLQVENLLHRQQTAQQNSERLHDQLDIAEARHEELLEQDPEDQAESIQLLQEQLESLVKEHQQKEQRLVQIRDQLHGIDQQIRQWDEERLRTEQQVNQYRDQIENLKMVCQETQVRQATLQEQFDETGLVFEEVEATLDAHTTVAFQEDQLKQTQQRIQRLGSINLAAIDEYEEEQQRKLYLDQQRDDLESALETLEKAIAKIDKDTRGRFKKTFEFVNQRINQMFPKLFGGGEAYLTMTGDDLLTTGVAIMAKPPGKKISSIQLLSGGEKALTAVAMVFAIFELNPAPFCMLDEVDAPLDEANVGRFCDLVREMSTQVQFIFITHNKATMELAENLIGVTMRESGVSRLVSVDLEQAVQVLENE